MLYIGEQAKINITFNSCSNFSFLVHVFTCSECLRFCFNHLLQQELDQFVMEWNSHRIRRNQRSAVAGIPDQLFWMSHLSGIVILAIITDRMGLGSYNTTLLRTVDCNMHMHSLTYVCSTNGCILHAQVHMTTSVAWRNQTGSWLNTGVEEYLHHPFLCHFL